VHIKNVYNAFVDYANYIHIKNDNRPLCIKKKYK
jgi:hypothetical protein